jgi:starch synthase
MSKLQVLAVTSEFYPLVKTGGLADVAGALPGALAEEDVVVTTLLPGYPAVLAGLPSAEPAQTIADLFGGPATLLAGRVGDARIIAIDAPHLFGRAGNPYVDARGIDWPDNPQRFAALARSAPTSPGACCPAGSRMWCMGMTGRRASFPPICASPKAARRRS